MKYFFLKTTVIIFIINYSMFVGFGFIVETMLVPSRIGNLNFISISIIIISIGILGVWFRGYIKNEKHNLHRGKSQVFDKIIIYFPIKIGRNKLIDLMIWSLITISGPIFLGVQTNKILEWNAPQLEFGYFAVIAISIMGFGFWEIVLGDDSYEHFE